MASGDIYEQELCTFILFLFPPSRVPQALGAIITKYDFLSILFLDFFLTIRHAVHDGRSFPKITSLPQPGIESRRRHTPLMARAM